MTYDEIYAFLTIFDVGSFSTASNKLFIDQSTLSRQIMSLEKELGYKLFDRNRGARSVQLTDEGKEFVPIARTLKIYMERAKNISTVMRSSFTLIQSNLLSKQLPDLDHKFLNDFPDVHFSCFSNSSSNAYTMVENGSADTAIVTSPQYSKFVDTIPIFKDTMLVVSSKKLSDNKVISSSVLDPTKELLFSWSPQIDSWHSIRFSNAKQMEAWNRHNIRYSRPTSTRSFTDNIDMLEKFLNVNDIWFFSTSMTVERLKHHPNFHCYEIVNGPPAWKVYYLKNKELNNKYLDDYINCIKSCLPSNKYITVY